MPEPNLLQATRRLPMTPRQKQLMMAFLFRSSDVYESARTLIQAGHFERQEEIFLPIWQATEEFHIAHGHLPPREVLLARAEQLLPQLVRDSSDLAGLQEDLEVYLRDAYRLPDSELDVSAGLELVQHFVDEFLASTARTVFRGSEHAPADLVGVLTELREQADNVRNLDSRGIDEPFPNDWDETPLALTSTGISFVDLYLNGGHAGGEIYGLLGPTGSCKTTLMVQMSTAMAENYRNRWEQDERQQPLPMVYYFSWEDVNTLRQRAVSANANIHRNRLDEGHWERRLRRAGMEDYERELFGEDRRRGVRILTEYERYRQVRERLNINWRIVGMTGSDREHPTRGTGYLPEIISLIRQDLRRCERQGIPARVGGIILDYVGAICERHCDHAGKPRDRHLRFLIGKFPFHARSQLAEAYQCPVWCIHQLSTQANAYASHKKPKHTDANEAKDFAYNCDFSFEFGTKSTEDLILFGCSKSRRAATMDDVIVRINGAYCRVERPAETYRVDPISRRFVLNSEACSGASVAPPDADAALAADAISGARRRLTR